MSFSSDKAAPLPQVRRLHRINVLLLSRDRRFLQVAAFLLRRKGFVVETSPGAGRALELVEHHAPDVVVLDGDGSLAEVARSLAEIEARRPSVAVVVVSDFAEDAPGLQGFRLLPKWSSADRLAEEVERAYLRLAPADELAADAG